MTNDENAHLDVSEVEDARLALERSEQQLRELIEKSPDAIGVYRRGKFVFVNATLYQSLGYDAPEQVTEQPVLDLIHPDDRALAQHRAQRLLDGEKVPPADIRFFKCDGQTLQIEAHSRAIVFEGKPAIMVVGRDITLKQKLLARAMQLDRKIAVGTLATGVAHEINNPLSYAKANVEFVRKRLQKLAQSPQAAIEPEDIADLIDALSDSADGLERIGGIVDGLETFIAHDDGKLAPVDVEAVLEVSLNLVYRQLDSQAHVVRELRKLPRVMATQGRLAEAFINVLTNALQSLSSKSPEQNEVRISTACVDDQVTIEISDTGCGMTREVVACAFDPFFSTRDEGRGTGLGLTIALNTFERLGGGIEIDSVLDEGTTVRMWLPTIERADLDEETQPMSLI